MKRTGEPGFRSYFAVPGLSLCRIGSWDSPSYGLFGAWYSPRGVSLRYRGFVLRLGR
jgi:hypothetical protein